MYTNNFYTTFVCSSEDTDCIVDDCTQDNPCNYHTIFLQIHFHDNNRKNLIIELKNYIVNSRIQLIQNKLKENGLCKIISNYMK
ncbi:MAG: hypothetical protein AABY22_22005 [Nanoarchaeota archaeon]